MVTIQYPCFPEGWMPSNEDIIFTITSDVANLNYFLIEVYVNGMNVITLRKVPIENNTVSVNLKDILSSFLETQNPYNNIYQGWANSSSKAVLNAYIAVYEHYNDDDFGPTLSYPINVWKSAVEHLERYSLTHLYDFDKKFTINQGKQFMGVKAVPDNSILFTQSGILHLSLPYAQYEWCHQTRNVKKPLSMFFAGTSTVYENVVGFDADGKAVVKFVTGISHSTDDTDHHLYRNFVDGMNLNRGAYKTPADATSTEDCSYIVFYYSSTFNNNLTTLDTLVSCPVILKICDANESWNIYYVSRDGGASMIQANHRATQKTSYKTSTKENLPAMREISTVNVLAKSSWTLNTQWLNENQNEEVKDMLESPEIWILHRKDNKKDTWIPVTLANAEYTTEEHNSHRLFQYSLQFEEAFYKNTLK